MHTNNFKDSVYAIVRAITPGTTLSYSEVAEKAGYKGASRAVGTLMRKNFDPSIPCHRVIRADGALGEYNRGGERIKKEILTKEGYGLFK